MSADTTRPEWAEGAILVLHLRASNDTNGNPRRCYALFDATGSILGVIDEGYEDLPPWAWDLPRPTVEVTPASYRHWLKHWGRDA